MPRKSPLLLRLLNLVLKPILGQTSELSNQIVVEAQQSLPTDRETWRVYWQTQGQPWRTEPEIDRERQEYLAKRRTISPDIEHGAYPFKGIKLDRADVEWLLATLDGRGPVDWRDESQRQREGLDLRGTDLCQADLRGLPLARMYGCIPDAASATGQAIGYQRDAAEISLEKAVLTDAHLEGAYLDDAHLAGAMLHSTYLTDATLVFADLRHTLLRKARLEKAKLIGTNLEGATLAQAHLVGADLSDANLEGADLRFANLAGADLRRAFFDRKTQLGKSTLSNEKDGSIALADVHWGDVDITVVKWSQIPMLGDEYEARLKKHSQKAKWPYKEGVVKDRKTCLEEHEAAVRANRQLAVALQAQGLNEQAARFAYRAQVLQRRVFWFEMVQQKVKLKQRVQAFGDWLFSWFLFLLTGYGYLLWHSFLTYFLTISFFTTIYHIIDPHLAWSETFVVSMTAFHGRGFSPSTFTPGDPLSFASAAEAFVGLIIEVTFIATLTQRFFNR